MPRFLTRVVAPTLTLSVALTLTACGGATRETTDRDGVTGTTFAFGAPADASDASDADRVIEIEATDALTFEPADITVAASETVTFRLVNSGVLDHDFTIGDQATQEGHESEMSEMGGMDHDEPNVAVIPAGDTVDLSWTFGDEGTVLVGCHQPGHYAAGMTGRITVEG